MWKLILTSILLGIGLAMDAFAVSMTNGLNEPKMKHGKALLIAFMFALFQALMPMIGWICVSLVAKQFTAFAAWVPYIALVLLLIIGGKMLFEGTKHNRESKNQPAAEIGGDDEAVKAKTSVKPLTFVTLLVQAVATSIDALSTGFSLADIAGNVWWQALISASIIAVVTFGIAVAGVYIGRRFGDKLGSKAEIVGGIILVAIGVEIFVTGVFF